MKPQVHYQVTSCEINGDKVALEKSFLYVSLVILSYNIPPLFHIDLMLLPLVCDNCDQAASSSHLVFTSVDSSLTWQNTGYKTWKYFSSYLYLHIGN
jgi:hypothetical protein